LGPHSWDGGLSATTVFWAVAIPNGSAHVDLDSGSASLHAKNICVFDAFTVANSIMGVNRTVNPVQGIINSLEIEWSGTGGTPTAANEPVNQMRGAFVEDTARIEVTATTPRTAMTALSNGHGFRFVSDPASTSVSHFALIGHEQNGIFF
jgi:hypothetical protein